MEGSAEHITLTVDEHHTRRTHTDLTDNTGSSNQANGCTRDPTIRVKTIDQIPKQDFSYLIDSY